MLVDEHDAPYLDMAATTDMWDLSWMVIDYRDIYRRLPSIREAVQREKIDFVMFSRNDQVAGRFRIGPIIKSLGAGYSTISGIDDDDRVAQMKACFSDFMNGGTIALTGPSIAPSKDHDGTNGTFTLVFDAEQVGCVRFAMDRVLGTLGKHNVAATFFATNIMKMIYPNFLSDVSSRGHEVGIHGKWHEGWLGGDRDAQTKHIGETLEHFGHDACGANFMYRMDAQTIEALIANGMKYTLFPAMNPYRPFGYPKLSTTPVRIRTSSGSILMVGASLETYKGPWPSVRNMIDSAYRVSRGSTEHITILCHPFRDGSKSNLSDLERMIEYLQEKMRLRPVTLSDMADRVGDQYPSIDLASWPLPSNEATLVRPSTMVDLKGLFPENILRAYRALKNRHEVGLERKSKGGVDPKDCQGPASSNIRKEVDQ